MTTGEIVAVSGFAFTTIGGAIAWAVRQHLGLKRVEFRLDDTEASVQRIDGAVSEIRRQVGSIDLTINQLAAVVREHHEAIDKRFDLFERSVDRIAEQLQAHVALCQRIHMQVRPAEQALADEPVRMGAGEAIGRARKG